MLKSGTVGNKTIVIKGDNVKAITFENGEAHYSGDHSLTGRFFLSDDGTFTVVEYSSSGRYNSPLFTNGLTTPNGVSIRITD